MDLVRSRCQVTWRKLPCLQRECGDADIGHVVSGDSREGVTRRCLIIESIKMIAAQELGCTNRSSTTVERLE